MCFKKIKVCPSGKHSHIVQLRPGALMSMRSNKFGAHRRNVAKHLTFIETGALSMHVSVSWLETCYLN